MSGILLSRRSKLGAGAAAAPTGNFITSQALGTLRNNYGEPLGFKFTVGASPLTVSHLARWVVAGNTGTHLVGIADIPTGLNVAEVSIPTSGEPAGWKWVALGTPYVLLASTSYWLGSDEDSGADQWYDHDTTVAHTADASVVGSAYRSGSSTWAVASAGDLAFVPVNFRYTL